MEICTQKECENKHYNRGVCQSHYRALLGTDALPRLRGYSTAKTCTVKGCTERFYAKSLCRRHYARRLANGHTGLRTPKRELHGTAACYRNGCRCTSCVTANREYKAALAAKRIAELPCGTPLKYSYGCRCDDCYSAEIEHGRQSLEHGTVGMYRARCRCGPCKRAYSDYKKGFWDTHPDYRMKDRARGLNRMAQRRGIDDRVTWGELMDLVEGKSCACGGHPSVVHTVPLKAGGSNTTNNLTTVCTACKQTL